MQVEKKNLFHICVKITAERINEDVSELQWPSVIRQI